ncbi:MAG: hypothetical protein GY763_00820 [Gammaproteobacteria bacterium]|nr:hypothetical protein [Gammaproteobacteria bacterium]
MSNQNPYATDEPIDCADFCDSTAFSRIMDHIDLPSRVARLIIRLIVSGAH